MSLAEDTENSEVLALNGVKGKKWKIEDLVDLRIVQAQGGDRIALWAEASDNREGIEGPQKATSEIIYLEVDSPEWNHRKLLDALREHLEIQLEALADRLEISYLSKGQPSLSLPDFLLRWMNARQKSINFD